jgi:hypothetical protein
MDTTAAVHLANQLIPANNSLFLEAFVEGEALHIVGTLHEVRYADIDTLYADIATANRDSTHCEFCEADDYLRLRSRLPLAELEETSIRRAIESIQTAAASANARSLSTKYKPI